MIRTAALASLFALVSVVTAQQVGTVVAERHPPLTWQRCTGSGCTNAAGSVVLDANWRWLHTTSGYTNCYEGNSWDASLCSDGAACARNCALDGAEYSATYGITTSGNALTLKFKTGANVGSRVFLMASDTRYEMFKLNNKEFTVDVDVSNLGCGLNGALYFSEMEADGGLARYPTNKAGAKYGTGYCDSQCPHDLKFINGEANVVGWNGSPTDPNAGSGQYGACCNEMDIWEANSISTAYTPHGCTVSGPFRCQGNDCGDGSNRYGGVCDKDGCDFNSFRMGDKSFYGKGAAGVDTSRKFTVVTQFITDDGTDTGELSEIRRVYVQDGRVIQNSKVNIPGMSNTMDSITENFCSAQKTAFGDTNDFAAKGGLAPMSKAFQNGVVLVMSVWADHAANMLWLDSTYPTDRDPSVPGAQRGTCATTSGKPADVEAQQGNASVTFSNIKLGSINSTYSGAPAGTNPGTQPPAQPAPAPAPAPTQAPAGAPLYGQCGGQGWAGPTNCAQGTCTVSNQYYSQCLP